MIKGLATTEDDGLVDIEEDEGATLPSVEEFIWLSLEVMIPVRIDGPEEWEMLPVR